MHRGAWLLSLVVSLGLSVGLYLAAVLSYSPPWNNPTADETMGAPRSALRVLVNDPAVEVRAKFVFNQFPEPDALSTWAEVTFFNITDPGKFQWVLVGTGRMRFESWSFPVTNGDVRGTYDALPPFVNAFVQTEPSTWTPPEVTSCDSRYESPGAVSVIEGGTGFARHVATDGWQVVAADGVSMKLAFPEIVARTDLTSAEWTIGQIGDTTAHMGMGKFDITVPDCVAVSGTEYRPPAAPPALTVEVNPGSKARGYKLADSIPPVPASTGVASWDSTEPVTVSARFESARMVKVRDSLLFAAGIVGGIFASLLVGRFTITPGRRDR